MTRGARASFAPLAAGWHAFDQTMTPGRTLAAMMMIDEMAARAEAAMFMALVLS